MLTRLLKIHPGRREGEGDSGRGRVEVVFPYQRPGGWLRMVIKVPRFHLLGQLMKEEPGGREGGEKLERRILFFIPFLDSSIVSWE